MRRVVIAACAGLALMSAQGAQAAGCLKGAAVGGVAGHFAGHHAILGALAGCAIGHHRAKMQRQQQQVRPAPDDQPNSM
jgi:outer membrane lipoprotein SlyB